MYQLISYLSKNFHTVVGSFQTYSELMNFVGNHSELNKRYLIYSRPDGRLYPVTTECQVK